MRLLIITQKVDENSPLLAFFLTWISKFAAITQKVTVICLYEGDHKLAGNIKVLSLGKESGASKIKYLYRFYKYIWVERNNYDAVFVHMNPIYILLGGWLWKILGKKISMWYAHGSVNLLLKTAEKITELVFTSTPMSFRVHSKKTVVLGHGIDMEKFKVIEKPKKTFNIISVGRISPVKDIETIINSTEILKKKRLPILVQIVGGPGLPSDEKYYQKLKNAVKDKGLSDSLNFVGPIPYNKIPEFLNKSHIMAHTSNTGSLDKVALEAMASGVLVVSSNDAVAEITPDDFKDEFIFRQGSSESLASKIINLYDLYTSDPDKYMERVGMMRETVGKNHNITNLIASIIDYLENN